MTKIIKFLKSHVKSLLFLDIPDPKACLIIEIDFLGIGYDSILKQKVQDNKQVVWYHFYIWSGPQTKYSTIKKEILSIVLCISFF